MKKIHCFLLVFIISFPTYALETITINQGHYDPVPIAVNYFDADNANNDKIGRNIIDVIKNDLKVSGILRPIPSAAFIETKTGITHKPSFTSWRQINASFLLNGFISELSSGRIKVSFVLWDTILEKDIEGVTLELSNKLWRRVAHKIADKIYERVTGDKGYFDTKIVYVSETGPPQKRIKKIAIMDRDGENHQYFTDGKSLVLTPRFSRKSDKILYLSYAGKTPRVHMRNLKTGKDVLIGNFPGMSFAPHFSPNGDKALMSIAKHGSTHIYEIDFNSMKTKKLTNGDHINVSPSYSPDGQKIVFNSDRNGSRQLYIMNSDGSNVERISFGGGVYAAPSWSPRGDYIAFTKITRTEGFTIGVMRPKPNENNGERIIASGYLVESPCFASNGRVIMFTKADPSSARKAARSYIYTIDITGYNERLIPTPKDASDPNWSNNLD